MQTELFGDILTPPLPWITLGTAFYQTDAWRYIRYQALLDAGGKCQCCGQRPTRTSPLHVDHIKPKSLYPHLALDLNNLQVLCEDCNLGKSNIDETDWREYDAIR